MKEIFWKRLLQLLPTETPSRLTVDDGMGVSMSIYSRRLQMCSLANGIVRRKFSLIINISD